MGRVLRESQGAPADPQARLHPGSKPGWWFPEEDAEAPHLYGVWKSNINTLIPHSRQGKLGFGAPFRTTLVKISKAQESDLAEADRIGVEGEAGKPIEHAENLSRIDNPELDPAAR